MKEQNEEEVRKFYDSLSPWNKQCFDILAIKPLIFHDLFARFDNDKSRFIQSEIPQLYNAFDGLSQLQDILVKASFKRIISLPIFCDLIRKYSPDIPKNSPIVASIILLGLTSEQERTNRRTIPVIIHR